MASVPKKVEQLLEETIPHPERKQRIKEQINSLDRELEKLNQKVQGSEFSHLLIRINHLRQTLKNKVEQFKNKEIIEECQSGIAEIAVYAQRLERLAWNTEKHSPCKFWVDKQRNFGEFDSLVQSLDVALQSLLQDKPDRELARKIRCDVEQQIVKHEQPFVYPVMNRFVYVWHSPSTTLKVMFGLFCSLLFCLAGFKFGIVMYYFYGAKSRDAEVARTEMISIEKQNVSSSKINPDQQEKLKELNQNFAKNSHAIVPAKVAGMLWVAAAGALGSIVSILIRATEEFHDQRYHDRFTPFFLGFFKPLIGASFGLLFLALINTGLFSIPGITLDEPSQRLASSSGTGSNSTQLEESYSNAQERRAFLLFAVAFVVGFSERLARDTISRFEAKNPPSSSS